MKKKQTNIEADKYIGVIDGLRSIAIIFIVWLHFWQQTWLTPYISFDNRWTKYIGITESHLHVYVRQGAVFVDLMILISVICNLWPYARALVLKEPWPDTKTFYKKRAIRILPSYYLCIGIMFAAALIQNKYAASAVMWEDILTRLTFTSMWKDDWYLGTQLNGVLWTVQVEVWIYLVMPLFAKMFRRFPVITCGSLWLLGVISTNVILYQFPDRIRGWANYPLTYAGFLPCGMLVCLCYAMIKKAGAENKYTQIFAALIAFGSLLAFNRTIELFAGQDTEYMHIAGRFERMLIFSVMTLALMLAGPVIGKVFSNKLFRWISAISYNLYIWHQVIAFWCKEYRLPYWEGDTPPNMLGDTAWCWKYQIIILVLSVVTAVVLTYGFEKPAAKYLQKKLKC